MEEPKNPKRFMEGIYIPLGHIIEHSKGLFDSKGGDKRVLANAARTYLSTKFAAVCLTAFFPLFLFLLTSKQTFNA